MNDLANVPADPGLKGFATLAELAHSEAGLVLSDAKSAMILSRLRHRMRAIGVADLAGYCEYIAGPNGDGEKPHMITALTTNVSSFFREPHHFELLSSDFLDGLLTRLKTGGRVRIWSAGCSNGQEPYSLAMHLLEHSSDFGSPGCKILATDIDTEVLKFAAQATYSDHQVENIDANRLSRYFTSSFDGHGQTWTANQDLRDMVTFKQLNLHADWPLKGPFDVIFCRNVVIYFDLEAQNKLWPKFAKALQPDGLICVGHSERIQSDLFETVGATAYKKSRVDTDGHTPTLKRSA